MPGGEVEGTCVQKQQEFIVALSGSFDVVIDNGKEKQTIFVESLLLRLVCSSWSVATNAKFFNQ